VTFSTIAVSGFAPGQYSFAKGTDTCLTATLAPGASCTVNVTFSQSPMATKGVTHTGQITFTDTLTGSPHVGTVNGVAP
jgi:hypothetical protein